MKGLNLINFRGFTQKRNDFCLLACIQSILHYYGDKNNYNQFQLFTLFGKYINFNTDHPYFKYFAKYLNTIIPEFQGIYDTHDFNELKEKIKSSLDDGIPMIISLKSIRLDRAHVVIACQYEDHSLRYFNPDTSLTDNFITITFSELLRQLKGVDRFDTLTILPLNFQKNIKKN